MARAAELSVNFVVPRGRLRGHPPPPPRCHIEADERHIKVQKHRNFFAVLLTKKSERFSKNQQRKEPKKKERAKQKAK